MYQALAFMDAWNWVNQKGGSHEVSFVHRDSGVYCFALEGVHRRGIYK